MKRWCLLMCLDMRGTLAQFAKRESGFAHACDSFVLCDHAPSAAASEIARQTNKQRREPFPFYLLSSRLPRIIYPRRTPAQQNEETKERGISEIASLQLPMCCSDEPFPHHVIVIIYKRAQSQTFQSTPPTQTYHTLIVAKHAITRLNA